jgi:hypothetical protein
MMYDDHLQETGCSFQSLTGSTTRRHYFKILESMFLNGTMIALHLNKLNLYH